MFDPLGQADQYPVMSAQDRANIWTACEETPYEDAIKRLVVTTAYLLEHITQIHDILNLSLVFWSEDASGTVLNEVLEEHLLGLKDFLRLAPAVEDLR